MCPQVETYFNFTKKIRLPKEKAPSKLEKDLFKNYSVVYSDFPHHAFNHKLCPFNNLFF